MDAQTRQSSTDHPTMQRTDTTQDQTKLDHGIRGGVEEQLRLINDRRKNRRCSAGQKRAREARLHVCKCAVAQDATVSKDITKGLSNTSI